MVNAGHYHPVLTGWFKTPEGYIITLIIQLINKEIHQKCLY